MAKIKFLVDTDVIIDYLKGVKPARELFRSRDIVIYCSVLTKKELLSKIGISNSEPACRLFNRSNCMVKESSTFNKKFKAL